MATSQTKSFSIVGKGLKLNTKADIEPHLKILRELRDVEEVHLGGNTLGIEASEALADVLVTLKSLKVADFADIFTGRLISEIPQALTAICNSLKGHTSLVEIDLSDNAFGGRSVDPIVPFLIENRTFQVLRLSNNGLGPAGATVIANALTESARRSKAEGKTPNLKRVFCGRNRLEDGSASAWAEAFEAHSGIVEVCMPQNGIRTEGFAILVRGLSMCAGLEKLDLQDNTAKGVGTRALATAMPSWPELQFLNVSECLLGSRAGIAFALALNRGFNKKLEVLNLELGELDHRSLSILANAIRDHFPNLTTLELNCNRADPEDQVISDIREALAVHDHEDALGELDDMEEVDEGDKSDEEATDEEEEEDIEEAKEPVQKDEAEADDLAKLMEKVSIR